MDERPIGLFDSGLGGLTVFKEIKRLLPFEDIIYFGDTARLPYGGKSPDAITRFSLENSFFLQSLGIKLLVIACHTASSIALGKVQERLSLPVIGVASIGIPRVVKTTKSKQIAVLGTTATIDSQIHAAQIQAIDPNVTVHSIACPLFVPLVEEGLFDHPATEMIIHHYLDPLKNHPIDTALLACTHYPWLHSSIAKVLGSNITLIEPSLICAEQVKAFLSESNQLSQPKKEASYTFYASESPEKFKKNANHFFSANIGDVKLKLLSS